MRGVYALVIFLFSLGMTAQQPTQQDSVNQASTKGSCSPAVSGTKNTITITCNGFDKKQAADLAKILNLVGQGQLTLRQIMAAIGGVNQNMESIAHPLFTSKMEMFATFNVKPSEATRSYIKRITPLISKNDFGSLESPKLLPLSIEPSPEAPLGYLLSNSKFGIDIQGVLQHSESTPDFKLTGWCQFYPDKHAIDWTHRLYMDLTEDQQGIYFGCSSDKTWHFIFSTSKILSFYDLIGARLCVSGGWSSTFVQVYPTRLKFSSGDLSIEVPIAPSPENYAFSYCSKPIARENIKAVEAP